MRIKLIDGKQKELISKAKENNTWSTLGKKIGVNQNYLRSDLYNENRLLDSKIFDKFNLAWPSAPTSI